MNPNSKSDALGKSRWVVLAVKIFKFLVFRAHVRVQKYERSRVGWVGHPCDIPASPPQNSPAVVAGAGVQAKTPRIRRRLNHPWRRSRFAAESQNMLDCLGNYGLKITGRFGP